MNCQSHNSLLNGVYRMICRIYKFMDIDSCCADGRCRGNFIHASESFNKYSRFHPLFRGGQYSCCPVCRLSPNNTGWIGYVDYLYEDYIQELYDVGFHPCYGVNNLDYCGYGRVFYRWAYLLNFILVGKGPTI